MEDKIYTFEGNFGEEIKAKKIINQDGEIWQIFNPENRKWNVIKERKLIEVYKPILAQKRIVIFEKVEKKQKFTQKLK